MIETNWLRYYQTGSKGIRQWPINWCTSQMIKHKISDWNFWTLNLMNQPITIKEKFPKLLSRRMRKRYYKTLGDQCNKQTNVPSLPDNKIIEKKHTFLISEMPYPFISKNFLILYSTLHNSIKRLVSPLFFHSKKVITA